MRHARWAAGLVAACAAATWLAVRAHDYGTAAVAAALGPVCLAAVYVGWRLERRSADRRRRIVVDPPDPGDVSLDDPRTWPEL